MCKTQKNNFFVVAAIVAAELHKAMLVAREISLTASNARALALRAGHGAAGFRALTDFIDELAAKTVKASRDINAQAVAMSQVASDTARAESALQQFFAAFKLGSNATHLHSLDNCVNKTQEHYNQMQKEFEKRVWKLKNELEELARELRTATVLAAMSRVEASQSGPEYESSLNVIASNVAEAANRIQAHVRESQKMFSTI